MQTVQLISQVRQQVTAWRQAGQRVAFVPTMGNLHEGHLDLVRNAQQVADKVVVSIFVNPTQFGPKEDFSAYPRTLEQDQQALAAVGCDLLFAPTVEEVYPRGANLATRVEVPHLSNVLCGAFRPGHFAGVAQVVCKLFNMVQPTIALFGEKDRQQLLVIRHMVEDLDIPIEIIGVPTIRDADGLAMSSRNAYLSADERARAATVYRELCRVREAVRAGERDFAELETTAWTALQEAGFRPDYFRIVRAQDYSDPAPTEDNLVVVAAAWLGRARLIDNLLI